MSELFKIKNLKYSNIGVALAVILLLLVALSTSCSKNDSEKNAKQGKADTAESTSAEDEEDTDDKRLTKNYVYKEIQNGTSLHNGLLLKVDETHPFTGQINNAEMLYSFLFDKEGEQVLAAGYPSDEALPEMLTALNALACDFQKQSRLNTLMVSSLVPEDEGSKTDEAYIGSCADLMLYDYDEGTFDSFTGEGDYAWIPENCYKYGFVMRGADRLRYVGREAAAYIRYVSTSGGAGDLDSLWDDIREYSFEKPLYFTAYDDTEYAAYFVPAKEDSTTTSIPIPAGADEREYKHFISGNNYDGYIVFAYMSESAPAEEYITITDESDPSAENDQGEDLL
ncbi:hypothetical protein [uncultured Ruminococcus sp.]|uniref:hypothetical protein n=1 Tax=uncultured Ruminococcus sp. TaxID=165186 RepID=UPI0025D21C2F|nr:hypothetical protein [uncultured Ruminococcus sp.]